ncbi:MAG: phosphoribosylanthranilate isomerase [Gammaproteobacteria bacterium]|nr:phosphoribosylanthranilate isomerase [Gammaproteobacteria bacterium]
MTRVRVKICCIANRDEAALASAAGADAVGLVSAMPSGPGVIDDAQIAEIARCVPPPVATFLLTSRVAATAIIEQHARCASSVLQLCDHLPPDELRTLRASLPAVKLVQVIHVVDQASVDEALAVAPLVDALLLDSGNPRLAVKELGGTGRTHDWRLSRQIRERCGRPLFLAGGLTPANVAEAVASVEPFGVDLCNGVRSEGRLDPVKLRAFFAALRPG